MARFYDDVKEHIDRRDYDGIEALDKAIVISATNIAKFADMTDQKAVNEYLTEDAIRDLPCVLPPFPYTFIEFTLPYVGTQGWLFTHAAIENGDVLHPEEKSKTGEGWMVRGTYFSSKVLNRPHATADFRIDPDGHIIDHTAADGELSLTSMNLLKHNMWTTVFDEMKAGTRPTNDPLLQAILGLTIYSVRICLWAFAFMHLKNAIIEDVEPPAALQKKRKKHDRPPLTSYKIIKVRSMITHSKNNAQGGHHAKPRLHIVKGRFRTDSEDAPLFGKWTGTWWWDAFERGDRSKGEIKKDYEIASEHPNELLSSYD